MLTVLVVDDDPAVARLLQAILATEGIQVEKANSGEAALAWLHDGHEEPDVILLDLMMPGMDGRQVFQEARRTGVETPVIFCSAYGANEARREVGAQGAIDKPFSPDTLIAAVMDVAGKEHH
jgi:CheY-like chemotaxis protein